MEIPCINKVIVSYRNTLAHAIQHGLQGFIVRNIEGESTEANDLSLIL